MYLKGWFSTWLKNNSLPNSSLDHISRYNQNNLNITNVKMIVNTTKLRYTIKRKKKVKDKEKISQSVIIIVLLFFIYRFIEKRVVELKRGLFN